MNEIILISNSVIYLFLCITFFLKLTDTADRDVYNKLVYVMLTLACLFSGFLIFLELIAERKNGFVKFNVIQTLFNFLMLLYMVTRVKGDRIFKLPKKDKSNDSKI